MLHCTVRLTHFCSRADTHTSRPAGAGRRHIVLPCEACSASLITISKGCHGEAGPEATDGWHTAHHCAVAEYRPVLWSVRSSDGSSRGRSVHGDQQRCWVLRGSRRSRRYPSDQRRASHGDAVHRRPAGEDARPSQKCSRCRALPGARQARLHGAVDNIHQAAMERVGTAGRAHADQEPEGDGLDRDIHRRRRAALSQRDLLDRDGCGPALRSPGRPQGPQVHHGHRWRLGSLLHRRREGACRRPRRGARPAGGVRGRARLHRRERRRRPRRGPAVRLHGRSVPKRLRRGHHGFQSAHVQPRDDRKRHQEGTRCAVARRANAPRRRNDQ